MNSKQAIDKVIEELDLSFGWEGMKEEFEEILKPLYKDLEILEKLRAKAYLFYKDRKALAKEFDKWCEDNNVLNCSESMATWFLCVKLREWLKNGN